MDRTPAQTRLQDLTDSILNQLTLKQCANILADTSGDIEGTWLAYLWRDYEESDAKQILNAVIQKRLEEAL